MDNMYRQKLHLELTYFPKYKSQSAARVAVKLISRTNKQGGSKDRNGWYFDENNETDQSTMRRELVASESPQKTRTTNAQNKNRNTGQNEEAAPPGASQSPLFLFAALLFLAFKLILFAIVTISGPAKITICAEYR